MVTTIAALNLTCLEIDRTKSADIVAPVMTGKIWTSREGGAVSNFVKAAYHPDEKVVRAGLYLDNYFGAHSFGVEFDPGGKVYAAGDCNIPTDVVFVPKTKVKQAT